MKIIKKAGFYTAFILPALTVAGFYLGGLWNYLTPVFVFIFMPLLDYYVGLDTTNVSEKDSRIIGEELYYRLITYLWTYVQFAFLGWCVFVISSSNKDSIIAWLGFTLSAGIVTGGIGITVAHELGHKKSFLERFYSKLILMSVCYMHFYIEHNRGHHIQVATPDDPATARRNENVYSFWYRSIKDGYKHAWKIENDRLNRKSLGKWNLRNQMIWFTFLPILFCFLLTLTASLWAGYLVWEVPLFFFAQSCIAFTLLELINYIEHYGIVRKKLAHGGYERVNPLHSWNASHLISNFFLFQLQRHSDHHANAIKRYQVLNHYDESPQLPFGYPTMILISLIPPLWFSIMNPLLSEWEEKIYRNMLAA